MVSALAPLDRTITIAGDITHGTDLIALWLYGKSDNMRIAYGRDIDRFGRSVGKPPPLVTLRDVQVFMSRNRRRLSTQQIANVAALPSQSADWFEWSIPVYITHNNGSGWQ